MVERIRRTVSDAVPTDATVLVVSKGDDDLLDLAGRRAWHFPQDQDGGYAGHYPADSAACIDELERLRAKGAEFVVVPSTTVWWLEYYQAFGEHLLTRYRPLARDEDSCAIFDLRPDQPEREGSAVSAGDWDQQRGESRE
ncbi:MAG: hypothetical protein O2930_03580 [Acidobacteria bacterium]|nr:hypothetical protein [Acidobacteriota bacterium]